MLCSIKMIGVTVQSAAGAALCRQGLRFSSVHSVNVDWHVNVCVLLVDIVCLGLAVGNMTGLIGT